MPRGIRTNLWKMIDLKGNPKQLYIIDKCCDGLVSYVRILTIYELSEESRKILAELITASLKYWAMKDAALFSRIEDFFSWETNYLEKTEFYRDLLSDLVRSKEFLDVLSDSTDLQLVDRRKTNE